MWGAYNIPKTSITCWMALLDKLKTRERLHRMQIVDSDSCALCTAATETVDKLGAALLLPLFILFGMLGIK